MPGIKRVLKTYYKWVPLGFTSQYIRINGRIINAGPIHLTGRSYLMRVIVSLSVSPDLSGSRLYVYTILAKISKLTWVITRSYLKCTQAISEYTAWCPHPNDFRPSGQYFHTRGHKLCFTWRIRNNMTFPVEKCVTLKVKADYVIYIASNQARKPKRIQNLGITFNF